MAAFDPDARDRLRAELLAAARHDGRISSAAITGSASLDRADRWSDIDLAFGIANAARRDKVLADWTAVMYRLHGAVHHVDMKSGHTVYRVFLLRDTQQVDIAFAPAAEFAARGPTFRWVFGTSAPGERPWPPADAQELIGMGWLHALHARACLQRGQLWRAEHMVSGVRDYALMLACLRHGLETAHARGVDLLPEFLQAYFAGALVREMTTEEIARAFRVAVQGLLAEIGSADADLGERLADTVAQLAGDVPGQM